MEQHGIEFSAIFKGLSVVRNCLRLESRPLKNLLILKDCPDNIILKNVY